MGELTKIEWTDHTFNAWIGCTKTSPACDYCYAETLSKFRGWADWGPGEPRQRTTAANWRKPLKWDAAAKAAGVRRRVFCNSLADVFDKEVSAEWRADLGRLIAATPNLDWLLLTKRHSVARRELPKMAKPDGNVRIGFTVENEKYAQQRLRTMEILALEGWRTFVSYEPALGPVDWRRWIKPGNSTIGWLIAGGESGANARTAHPDWFRQARNACAIAGVPFHFKQWGEWRPPAEGERYDTSKGRAARPPAFIVSHDGTVHCFAADHIDQGAPMIRIGKARSGALLDGREHREFAT